MKIRPGFILAGTSTFLLLIGVALRIEAQPPTRERAEKISPTTAQSPTSKEKIIKAGSPFADELARQKGGMVKAMLYVDSNGKIVRCFNSFLTGTAANTQPCGITAEAVSNPQAHQLTIINFGFKVNDRFILTTPVIGNRFQGESAQPTSAPFYFHPAEANTVVVTTSRGDQAFMIFVF